MSPHSAYVMASQQSPALPHTLPFISSPDSTNTTTSSSAPVRSATPLGQQSNPSYYPNASAQHFSTNQATHQGHDPGQQNSHQQKRDAKPTSFSGVNQEDESPEVSSDPEQPQSQTTRPVLETDSVVSSEVGDVPGILHQDLHPDGQPRRPMNAFMIFARHRRPAIQAKEPGLKTGEISKRLSHDWKNLPEEDKLHYLEQAKLLKDEFHSRFPEYVYKRRPNNTGKRRSSTSQQQLPTKFSCGPGAPQIMGPPMSGGMTHRPEMHGHPHQRQIHNPGHGDLYQGHPHHLARHHAPPPGRPLSSLAQPSSKVPGHPFYPQPNDPSSPRYHNIGHSFANSSCGPPGHRTQPGPGQFPSISRGPTLAPNSAASGTGQSLAHSPRSASPGPSPVNTANGISQSYLRLPNSHAGGHPSQQSPGNYPWFSNEHHYSSGPTHTHQAQTPLSASRSSFYYPSWPSSGTPDSQSICASDTGTVNVGTEPSENQPVNHSRAASYSAGPALYRPPSPMDRARQLSLPSHVMTNSPGTERPSNNNTPNSGGIPYSGRSQPENQSGESGISGSNQNPSGYGAYSSQEVNRSYTNGPISGNFSSNGSARGSIARPAVNHSSVNGEAVSQSYDSQSHSNNSHTGNNETHQSNGFGNHCSPIHHPPPPQPPPAGATGHHPHHSAHSGPTNSVAPSVAY